MTRSMDRQDRLPCCILSDQAARPAAGTEKEKSRMKRYPHLTEALVTGCLTVAGGCQPESAPAADLVYEIRDSAWIPIAENTGFPSPENSWVVEAEPFLSIGGPSADPPATFTVVTQAARLGDGRIAILESEVSDCVSSTARPAPANRRGQRRGAGRIRVRRHLRSPARRHPARRRRRSAHPLRPQRTLRPRQGDRRHGPARPRSHRL